MRRVGRGMRRVSHGMRRVSHGMRRTWHQRFQLLVTAGFMRDVRGGSYKIGGGTHLYMIGGTNTPKDGQSGIIYYGGGAVGEGHTPA